MDGDKEQGGESGVGGVQDGAPKSNAKEVSKGFDELHSASDLLVEYLTSEPEKAIPTGIEALDRAIGGGLRHKCLYVIAARTGGCKTSLALSIARRMSLESKLAVLFLSLELDKKELIERVICQATLTPLRDLEVMVTQGIAAENVKHFRKKLNRAWLHIEDLKSADILSLDTIWDSFKHNERKPDMIVIDHLQTIKLPASKNQSRADALSEYMADLKKFCKARNVIALVCCQINRMGSDKPNLTHLKSSGGIEENADIVMIGHRIGEDKAKSSVEASEDSDYEVFVAKHRRGPESTITLKFRPPCFEFLEPTTYGEPKHPSTSTQVVEEDDKDEQIVIPG